MFASVLIANRGEIARRIARTARRMGIRTIAVYTDADRTWPHWRECDDAVLIGSGPAQDSYLSIERIMAAAGDSGAEAVHPGYGFLSENADLADACASAGVTFVGPPAAAIRAMGSKSEAKAIMARAGVPVVPGYSGDRQDPEFLSEKAYQTGYPVMIKAVAGGGGRGMRRVDRALEFEAALLAAKREALASFGNDQILVERYVDTPRHIEVQIFGDAHGNIVHLFERDCSVQRRHQKIVEEAPAPGLPEEMRQAIGRAAVTAAAAVGYSGAGTVEFIADASRGLRLDGFYFMEMNTRLQVEHPVTEAVTGIDLVEWQFRAAAGERLPLRQEEIVLAGHAIEARLYAEDPAAGFRPSTGRLWAASLPETKGVRVDSGVEEGTVITSFYDSMLAKIIAVGADRGQALTRLNSALEQVRIAGLDTNAAFLSAVTAHPVFAREGVDTGFLEREMAALVSSRPEVAIAAPALAEWLGRAADRFAAAAPGAWSRTDGFELGGLERRSGFLLEVGGSTAPAEIAWTAAGPKILSLGGRPADAKAVEIVWGGRDAFVLSEGKQLRVGFPDPLARDLDTAVADGEVHAPMHGRIAHVAVTVGTRVAEGEMLFTLEAMKMEHNVVAPLAGIVRDVRIAPGVQVEQGAPAVSIEPGSRASKEGVSVD